MVAIAVDQNQLKNLKKPNPGERYKCLTDYFLAERQVNNL